MTALVTDNLPLVSGAPGGIAKLRDLILDLAIRGKLTKREPRDLPVSELLAEIKSARTSSARSKRASAAPDAASPPFEIPRGWAWIRLGDLLSKIGAGSTPLGGRQAYVDVGVKFLRSQNVWNEGLRLDDVALISAETHARMSGTHVRPGDILFNITGASIGRCALVPDSFDTGNVSQHVTIIRPLLGSTRRYLHVALMSKLVQDAVMAVQVGVSREGLSIGKLAQFYVPLPPLTEQDRIVAKVDELMVLCDRLEAEQADAEAAHAKLVETLLASLTQARDAADFRASWRQLAEHFHTLFTTEASVDALRLSLYELAISGRLHEQCAEDVPAAVALHNIREAKRRAGHPDARARSTELVDAGAPTVDLPAGWERARFANVALEIATGPFGSLIHQSDYQEGGVPLINPSHMVDGRIVHDPRVALPPHLAEELSAYRLFAGDMVMARRGEVGRVALVEDAQHGWLCGTGSFRLRFTGDVHADFVRVLFHAPSVRRYLAGAAVGTTMVNLNHGVLANLPVALPPLAEQRRIVKRVNELLALCDQLRSNLTRARLHHEGLAAALVEQAVA